MKLKWLKSNNMVSGQISWGIDQTTAINKMLDTLIKNKIVKSYFAHPSEDDKTVKYTIICFHIMGFFHIGYESAHLMKYI